MHQGNAEMENAIGCRRIWPGAYDFFLITHAHIIIQDYFPAWWRMVFAVLFMRRANGRPGEDIALDSAHIQEVDTNWKMKKMQRYENLPILNRFIQQKMLRLSAH